MFSKDDLFLHSFFCRFTQRAEMKCWFQFFGWQQKLAYKEINKEMDAIFISVKYSTGLERYHGFLSAFRRNIEITKEVLD